MGNWTVVIQGNGIHDHDHLDKYMLELIEKLKKIQQIEIANITTDIRRRLL